MHEIRKYANRKLYDKTDSRYVTLGQLADVVRRGEDVEVRDHLTGSDITAEVLAHALYEEERRVARLDTAFLSRILRGEVGASAAPPRDEDGAPAPAAPVDGREADRGGCPK